MNNSMETDIRAWGIHPTGGSGWIWPKCSSNAVRREVMHWLQHTIRHPFLNRSSAPGNEAEQHHDQRNHQQDMDYASQRVAGDETEQPQDEQNYRNCV